MPGVAEYSGKVVWSAAGAGSITGNPPYRAACFRRSIQMKKYFFLLPLALLIFPWSGAAAKTYKIKKTGAVIRLKIGDTLLYAPLGYSVTLEGFTSHTSKCAVPGRNCGSGYFPGTLVLPKLKISIPDKCSASPVPKACEFTHAEVASDKDSWLEVKMISVFEPCYAQENPDNKYSCFINVIKNGPYKPPYAPENCSRIDEPERRDACFEAIADELGDPKICDLIKGNEGFQCVYLRAKTAGDPEICRTLKRNRWHHTDRDYSDQVASCLSTVKPKK